MPTSPHLPSHRLSALWTIAAALGLFLLGNPARADIVGEMAVTGPGGAELNSGASVNFGTVALGTSSVVRTFTIANAGQEVLSDVEVGLEGVGAADFELLTDDFESNLGPQATTTFMVVFTPQGEGAKSANLAVTSPSLVEPFSIALTATATAAGAASVEIVQQPVSQILPMGGTLVLTAAAQGNDSLTYQWKKNNGNVAGATSPELKITGLKATHAGAYKCVVTTKVNGKNVTATTADAHVALVDTVAKTQITASGARVTLAATTAGTGLSYQWYFGITPIDGATAKTWLIKSPQSADAGNYTCQVTAPGGSLSSGLTKLVVYEEPPIILLSEGDALPPAIVGGSYDYTVPVNDLPGKTPIAYTAAGLPPGLTVHKTLGVISGKPTASKAAPYDVTLTASNAKGKSVVKVKLSVAPLDERLIGTYTAVLTRFMDLNANLGGRLDLVTTVRGTFSGKLTLGASTFPFTGVLDADVEQPLVATGTATVKRPRDTSLELTFTLDAESNWISIGGITDGTASLEFSGWRKVWNKNNSAAAYAGYYTFGLAMPESAVGAETLPQGDGYGAYTVAPATGALTVAGKLPDGTAYTCATFAGPGGEVGLFQILYPATGRGSLVGTIFIGVADPATNNDTYGSLSWWFPGSTARGARTYVDGFDPLDLTLEGAVYLPPVAPKVILGLDEAGPGDAVLTFANPFSDIPAPGPSVALTIGLRSKITLPIGDNNPRKTTLAITAAKGSFSGRFTLKDADLVNATKTVTRTGNYSGIIVRNPINGEETGRGHFLLPQRPLAGETAAQTKILSGKVTLEVEAD